MNPLESANRLLAKMWAALVGPPLGLPVWDVYEDVTGKWRWRLIAGNGEIVAQGEQHGSAHDAIRAAEGVDRIVRQARRHLTGVEGRTRL